MSTANRNIHGSTFSRLSKSNGQVITLSATECAEIVKEWLHPRQRQRHLRGGQRPRLQGLIESADWVGHLSPESTQRGISRIQPGHVDFEDGHSALIWAHCGPVCQCKSFVCRRLRLDVNVSERSRRGRRFQLTAGEYRALEVRRRSGRERGRQPRVVRLHQPTCREVGDAKPAALPHTRGPLAMACP